MGSTNAAGRPSGQLGRYELISRIGEGGMADVYLARQRGPMGFEKLVVLKLAHPNLAAQKNFVDMLLREARVAALLKHANVVDVYELGEVDGTYYIAMEYLEGEALLTLLRASREQDPLDPLSIARIIADAAEGLHAAHELRSLSGERIGLVHHDISPGNIMVLYSGQVKLVDFGVANALSEVMLDAEGRKMVAGKLGYLAPEKLRGEAFDHRSDIFSLGVVLWESLTSRRLYKGENDAAVRQQVLRAEVPAPSSLNAGVPAALDAICQKALAKTPADRYATAAEMAAALEAVLRGARYNNKNALIGKFMRDTFAGRQKVRQQLIREASTAGGPTESTVAAALDLNRLVPLADTPPVGVAVARASSVNMAASAAAAAAAVDNAPAVAEAPKRPSGSLIPSIPSIPSVRKGIVAADSPQLAGVLANLPPPNAVRAQSPSRELAAPVVAAAPAVVAAPVVAAPVVAAPAVAAPVAAAPVAELATPAVVVAAPEAELATPAVAPAMVLPDLPPSSTPSPTLPDVITPKSPVLPPAAAIVAMPRMSTIEREFLEGPSTLIATEGRYEDDEPWQAAPRSKLPWIIGGATLLVAAIVSVIALTGGGKKAEPDAAAVAMVKGSDAPASNVPSDPSAIVVDAAPLIVVDAAPVTVDAAVPVVVDAAPPIVVDAAMAVTAPVKDPIKPMVKDPVKPMVKDPVKDPIKEPVKPVAKDPLVKPAKPTRAELDAQYKAALQQFVRGDAEAVAAFRRIVHADSSYATAWRGLGLALAKNGSKADAAKALKKYLALSPNASDAAQIRARLEQLK